MCQPQASQNPPDGAAMNLDGMGFDQLRNQFIERDLALGGHARLDPIGHARQLTVPTAVTLRAWLQRSGFTAQLHQLVDEFRRNPEMPGRLAVPVTFINIRHNPRPQLKRMWLSHP